MAVQGRRSNARLTIIGIIVAAVATILGGVLAGPIASQFFTNALPEQEIFARVADANNEPLSGAEVLLFFNGGPLSQITDANGSVTIKGNIAENTNVRMVVSKNGYEIHEETRKVPIQDVVNVRLANRSGGDGHVIFRVVDQVTKTPLSGAEIIIIVGVDILRQITDSDGIAKFALKFPETEKLDVQISVATDSYEIKSQISTIQPGAVRDILLNGANTSLEVANITPLPSSNTQSTAITSNTAVTVGDVLAQDIDGVCLNSINFGQTIECEIKQPEEVHKYSLTLAVDDRIFVRSVRMSETLQPWIRIFDPQNNLVCEQWSERVTDIECVAPRSGEYRIDIADASRERKEVGKYTLFLQRLNRPGKVLSIEYGRPITNFISRSAKVDSYFFAANAEDRVILRAIRTLETFQPWVRIYGPDGLLVCEAHNERWIDFHECTFPRTGNYTILMSDGSRSRRETGSYQLYMQRLNFPDNYEIVTVNQDTPGTIVEVGQINTLLLQGQADEKVIIKASRASETVHPWIRVYQSDGRLVCEAYGEREAKQECLLPRTGQYTILVSDGSRERKEIGQYIFSLSKP
jgi:hypothetical protein